MPEPERQRRQEQLRKIAEEKFDLAHSLRQYRALIESVCNL
jgi:hypothetical protein